MNRYCIDWYKATMEEVSDDKWELCIIGDIVSEYFDDESEFLYRVHQLEAMDDVRIDGAYRVELVPY